MTKRIFRGTYLVLAVLMAAAVASCDGAIYDNEGDCDIQYRLQFRFERNLLFTDAFPQHVHSVGVYAFDSEGLFAWQRSESGEQLAGDNYSMLLTDIPEGDYRLVAWCGMDNAHLGEQPENFTLPVLTPGVSTLSDLKCRMERERCDQNLAHSRADLWPLFHGTLDNASFILPDGPDADGQTITYTIDLTKDTNRVRVILQQLSGEDIDVDNFTFRIDGQNGLMNHDNSLADDENITYHPWSTSSGTAGVGRADDGAFTPVQVAIADLTVGRLTTDSPLTLTVTNPRGETTARIPLVDYALLVKGNYSRPMEDQEFLDREDNYTLTFFLDENQRWAGASVIINSWRVVLDKTEID